MTFVRRWKSITECPTVDDLPALVILTGPNGAGKSQVLDAIEAGALQVDGLPSGQVAGEVRIFRLSELMAQVEQPQAAASFRDRWVQVAQHIKSLVENGRMSYPANPELIDQMVINNLRANTTMISEGALRDLLDYRAKPLHEYTQDEIRDALPLLPTQVDPFRLSVSEVFATYFLKQDANVYQRFKQAQGKPHADFLSDEEFLERFGPAPWDILNESLLAIGLNYAFDPPVEMPEGMPFRPILRHLGEDVQLEVENLSTGERTLLAIALSLYTGTTRTSAYLNLPRILLLDEPDASLHPSMVLGLLKVLQEVFIERHGLSILMTTHSPSTVALAPESSLYSMRRGVGERLSKVSTDQAVAELVVGIPTLSVRVEDRKTVIVEEKDDAQIYEVLYGRLRSELNSPWALQFLPSGSGSSQHPENAGSSTEVRRLVRELRASGSDAIFGIVDRDSGASATETIFVPDERYSIENYVLDPLLISALLLMHNLAPALELGAPGGVRHFELNATHAQDIVEAVAVKLDMAGEEQRTAVYEGGFTIGLPVPFFDMRGHDLAEQWVASYPALRRFPKLMQAVVGMAARDVPQYVPLAFRSLFERIVRA